MRGLMASWDISPNNGAFMAVRERIAIAAKRWCASFHRADQPFIADIAKDSAPKIVRQR
jgi:hypothetical protein